MAAKVNNLIVLCLVLLCLFSLFFTLYTFMKNIFSLSDKDIQGEILTSVPSGINMQDEVRKSPPIIEDTQSSNLFTGILSIFLLLMIVIVAVSLFLKMLKSE